MTDVFMLFEQPAVYNYTIDEESGSARGEPVIQVSSHSSLAYSMLTILADLGKDRPGPACRC